MLDKIISIDTDLFLFLNSLNSPFWDEIMYWFSHKFFWIPLYLFLAYLLFKKFGWRRALILFGLVIVTFAITNTISAEVFKKGFERLRPCHNPEISHLVHLVNGHCGGQFGFFSSHASNVFGLAMIFSLFLKKRIKWFSLAIFSWAGIVSYSRIYLGVHYPLDILCGALFGVSVAVLVFFIYVKFIHYNIPRFKGRV